MWSSKTLTRKETFYIYIDNVVAVSLYGYSTLEMWLVQLFNYLNSHLWLVTTILNNSATLSNMSKFVETF